MRADKIKNTISVAKAIINSDKPATYRELSNETGLGTGTIQRAVKELEKNGTLDEPEVIDFIKLDLELQGLAMKEKIRRLRDEAREQPYQALDSFDNTSFKRSQLLQGKATDRIEISGYDLLSDIKKGTITSEEAYDAFNRSKNM